MVKDIVFASSNIHKTAEIKQLLAGKFNVLNLKDIGCTTEIPETGETFDANAYLKSIYVLKNYQLDCFADDSGLEVEALNNAPGVYSARYSGIKSDQANLDLLLENLTGIQNRKACFKTVICLILNGQTHYFEGAIEGKIAKAPAGSSGFGYDPVFVPEGYTKTFAELTAAEKNTISHRAIATKKMADFLLKAF